MVASPSTTLRAAVILDGRPIVAIARDARLPHSVISRFIRGERGLTLRSFDRLAGVVRLEMRPMTRP